MSRSFPEKGFQLPRFPAELTGALNLWKFFYRKGPDEIKFVANKARIILLIILLELFNIL